MNTEFLNLIPSALTIIYATYGSWFLIEEIFYSIVPFTVLFTVVIVGLIHFFRIPQPEASAVEATVGKEPHLESNENDYVMTTVAHRGALLDAPENSLKAFRWVRNPKSICSYIILYVYCSTLFVHSSILTFILWLQHFGLHQFFQSLNFMWSSYQLKTYHVVHIISPIAIFYIILYLSNSYLFVRMKKVLETWTRTIVWKLVCQAILYRVDDSDVHFLKIYKYCFYIWPLYNIIIQYSSILHR